MSDQVTALRIGEPPPLPAEATRYYPTHPLFPLPSGERETKEIHEITFDRVNDRGVKERCPDRFRADELTSLAQVVDRFGGGTYQFIAFNSRGNFSRWTPEKDKVRIELPSKPFRTIEPPTVRAAVPPPAAEPAPAGPREADLVAFMLRQMVATQERTDRLIAKLLECLAARAATPRSASGATQLGSTSSAGSWDPMMMLLGIANVLENLRPAQASDNLAQLSGLASVASQLAEPQPRAAGPSDLLNAVTSAVGAGPHRAAASPPSAPARAHGPTPPDLVWVLLPEIGPVLMRTDQAARALARTAAPQAASTPPVRTAAPVPITTPTASAVPAQLPVQAPQPWLPVSSSATPPTAPPFVPSSSPAVAAPPSSRGPALASIRPPGVPPANPVRQAEHRSSRGDTGHRHPPHRLLPAVEWSEGPIMAAPARRAAQDEYRSVRHSQDYARSPRSAPLSAMAIKFTNDLP